MKCFKKLAIFGGSFNPVHIGHLSLAEAVLDELKYDRVIFIPAFQSPLKNSPEGASSLDRLEMLAASIAGDPRFSFDNCEIRRRGISYTVDTLKDFIDRYEPDGKPGLILGNDLVSTFDKWQAPGEIAELADIIIARREEAQESFPYPHKALNNEIIDVSSRSIREKINNSEYWQNLVPQAARLIIEERFLYGYTPIVNNNFPGKAGSTVVDETILLIENDVRLSLDFNRFIHSRNTALLAWDLCLRFGLDEKKGYLAGIAHDLCKEMEDEELIALALADGGRQTKLEQKKIGLLHARAAAVLVEKKYGITDRDILDAIRYHTTGSSDMCPLAKIVYVADKIEISRVGVDPYLRKLISSADLDTLFHAVLDDTVAVLKSRHMDLSYGTKRLLTAIHKRNQK